jgi:hypothetical protein
MGAIATPDDPGILVSFREYVDYGDNQYLVVSYDNICQGSSPSWQITPGFNTSFSGTVPVLDADHPVTIRWELKLTSNAKKVMSDSILWLDSNNKRISFPSFIGGTVAVSADKPLAGSKTFQYGTPGPPPSYVCSVSGGIGDNGAISLSWENGTTSNTSGTVNRRYRVTLVDFTVSEISGSGGGPDTAEAAFHYTSLLNIIKGSSRTFGSNGDICQPSSSNDSNVPAQTVSYANTLYSLAGASVSGFIAGRWAKGTGKVKWSSCDANASIYESLPSTLCVGVAADSNTGLPETVRAKGFSTGTAQWIDTSQRRGDMATGLSAYLRTLSIPAGPLESMYTEEWWDVTQAQPFRWFYPVTGGGSYSYCNVALKWKFEGPI